MKPYYEQGGIRIYHGDCREVLPTLSRGAADVLVTDPPYGDAYVSNHRRTMMPHPPIAGDENEVVAIEGLRLGLPCLKDKAHAYIFGNHDLTSLPLSSPVQLIWDKGRMTAGDLSAVWGRSHETIQFACYMNRPSDQRIGRGNLTARLRKGSVLRVPRPTATRHPTEKPVLLLRELIESSSRIGDQVLDPFMGVGSTLAASRVESRCAIGIEIEERYCEIAAKRLSQEVLDFGGAA